MEKALDLTDMDRGIAVAVGVCRELDRLRHTYNGLPDLLTQVIIFEILS